MLECTDGVRVLVKMANVVSALERGLDAQRHSDFGYFVRRCFRSATSRKRLGDDLEMPTPQPTHSRATLARHRNPSDDIKRETYEIYFYL